MNGFDPYGNGHHQLMNGLIVQMNYLLNWMLNQICDSVPRLQLKPSLMNSSVDEIKS